MVIEIDKAHLDGVQSDHMKMNSFIQYDQIADKAQSNEIQSSSLYGHMVKHLDKSQSDERQ